jgi:hypothetical protein
MMTLFRVEWVLKNGSGEWVVRCILVDMRVWLLLALAAGLHADDLTRQVTARVSEEAEAFLKIAPNVLGTETLHQTALKTGSRFHPRATTTAPREKWVEHDIVSEYGFATFATESGAIHELRRVITADGRKVAETKKAQEELAKAMTASDDNSKKELLKQFENYGLSGAVNDFGQILLLFTRRNVERYEFTARGSKMIGYDKALVFSYKQIDGPESLTVFNPKKHDQASNLRLEGEIRVRATDFVPLQITLDTHQGDAPNALREEAAVTYKMSKFGALLPASTEHQELRNGHVVAQNQFTYTDFHMFGASSDVKFEPK